MSVIRLDDAWSAALEELLLQEPQVNLFLIGYADAVPLRRAVWYGVPDGPRLRAACLLLPGALLVPYAPFSESDAEAMGSTMRKRHRPTMLVGPRAASDALWDAFAPDAPVDRRYDQRLYVCDEAPETGPVPGFRKATLADLPEVAEHARRMEFEDLGRWPDAADPVRWRSGIRRRIENGNTWIIHREGSLRFQIHVGTITAWGAQVGGTWVPPEDRGQGLATQGMLALGRAMLPGHRQLTLHVNEANEPAVRTYRRAGYREDVPFRLITLGEEP